MEASPTGRVGDAFDKKGRRSARWTARVLAVVVGAELLASAFAATGDHRFAPFAKADPQAQLRAQGPVVSSGGSSSSAARPPASRRIALAGSAVARGDRSGPVSCQTDLSLADAPGTAYNFLCSQGGAPVTWPTDRISIHESGLTPLQSAAFSAAVAQWARAARFHVTFVGPGPVAQVTVTDALLGSGAAGYVEDGYTTVSYQCTPRCVYSSARIQLSATASLSQPDWVSTILHELGHVAGLNHVSKVGEVMYPYLIGVSPVVYQPGDLAGLAVLAEQRAD